MGNQRTINDARLGGLPVAGPVLDVHSVGAGGGSIARLDDGGALRVGPESAGAYTQLDISRSGLPRR